MGRRVNDELTLKTTRTEHGQDSRSNQESRSDQEERQTSVEAGTEIGPRHSAESFCKPQVGHYHERDSRAQCDAGFVH